MEVGGSCASDWKGEKRPAKIDGEEQTEDGRRRTDDGPFDCSLVEAQGPLRTGPSISRGKPRFTQDRGGETGRMPQHQL